MILVIGHLRLPPEKMVDVRQAAGAMLAATRQEPGCVLYAFAEDLLEPELIRIVERWASWDTLKAHGGAPHTADWRAALKATGVVDREIIAYEAGEVRPL